MILRSWHHRGRVLKAGMEATTVLGAYRRLQTEDEAGATHDKRCVARDKPKVDGGAQSSNKYRRKSGCMRQLRETQPEDEATAR